MKDSKGIIRLIRRISAHYQHLEVTTDDPALRALQAGQTVLAHLVSPDETDTHLNWHPYLREQWWSVGFTSQNVLVIEAPFSHRYQPDQVVQLLGPVGKPFMFRPNIRTVLLIAYHTDPIPLTVMISRLLRHNIGVTLVLLGAAQQYTTEHLPPEVEIITSEANLEWPDMEGTFNWADQIFTVVPRDDELRYFREIRQRLIDHHTRLPQQYLFGVFQLQQPCGVGACDACLVRVKRDLVHACTQGPAFDLAQVDLPR